MLADSTEIAFIDPQGAVNVEAMKEKKSFVSFTHWNRFQCVREMELFHNDGIMMALTCHTVRLEILCARQRTICMKLLIGESRNGHASYLHTFVQVKGLRMKFFMFQNVPPVNKECVQIDKLVVTGL